MLEEQQPDSQSGTGFKPPAPGTEGSKPIDKWFWFKLHRVWVNGAEDRIQKQADGIQNAAKWVLGLGSTSTAISIALRGAVFEIDTILCFILTILLLFGSYWLSILAVTKPSRNVEEGNEYTDIKRVYNNLIKGARVFLLAATVCLIIGMLLFPFAIFLTFGDKPTKEAQLSAAYILTPDRKCIQSIDLSGSTPDSTILKFRLDSGRSIQTSRPIKVFNHVLAHSRFDFIYPLDRLVKLPKSNVYLTLYYKFGTDSIHSQPVKLKALY